MAAVAGVLGGMVVARPELEVLFLGLAGVLLPTATGQAAAALLHTRAAERPLRWLSLAAALIGGFAAGNATLP
ncbi:hypothetical protein [Streptomyces sp. NBC_01304]|uniref:hypothetical protein n=1 Tax=Streptomyces sp. NBC_01304 TaxID=2903818 RepID=UPI002E1547EE|nr:hypothetical protein OG430_41820 [Streptomyces sp. NBC_01304]